MSTIHGPLLVSKSTGDAWTWKARSILGKKDRRILSDYRDHFSTIFNILKLIHERDELSPSDGKLTAMKYSPAIIREF